MIDAIKNLIKYVSEANLNCDDTKLFYIDDDNIIQYILLNPEDKQNILNNFEDELYNTNEEKIKKLLK
jgi:hypothetical protein